jgi:hypothetical protein
LLAKFPHLFLAKLPHLFLAKLPSPTPC